MHMVNQYVHNTIHLYDSPAKVNETNEFIMLRTGIAVVFVITLTSFLLVLLMIIIWNILLIISFVVIIGSMELAYLSSVLYKFDQGGYLPLASVALLMTVMFVWNNVY